MSSQFKALWKEELRVNPHLFSTEILSTHQNRQAAFEAEAKYQKLHDVVASSLYINKAIASKLFFYGAVHSEESRKKMSIAAINRSEEHYVKVSQSLKNKPKSQEHRDALKTAWQSRSRILPDDQKRKISKSLTGQKRTAESKANISKGKKGVKQQQITCPHCDKTGGISAMKVYHFDRCKSA